MSFIVKVKFHKPVTERAMSVVRSTVKDIVSRNNRIETCTVYLQIANGLFLLPSALVHKDQNCVQVNSFT